MRSWASRPACVTSRSFARAPTVCWTRADASPAVIATSASAPGPIRHRDELLATYVQTPARVCRPGSWTTVCVDFDHRICEMTLSRAVELCSEQHRAEIAEVLDADQTR